jgi:hypothetical protein
MPAALIRVANAALSHAGTNSAIALPAVDAIRIEEPAVQIHIRNRGKKWRQSGDKSRKHSDFEACRMQNTLVFSG